MRTSVLRCGEETIQVKRGAVKNLYLRVKPPDGHIEVTAPQRVSDGMILDFVTSKGSWISHARSRLSASISAGSQGGSPTSWSDEDLALARQSMQRQLSALLDHWVPVVGRAPSAISLRLMTSRWGSCTPATCRIRLNLELARLDPRFLEYVLVHELTHLYVHGHGPEFRRRMDLYLPGWKALRKELNTHVIV
jgi:predicted metal-dependent hydrolase